MSGPGADSIHKIAELAASRGITKQAGGALLPTPAS